jgi:YbgC/YbaW family acyl-CoA thioester hydrolase
VIHETNLRVRYAEIDAQGHVNNAVYLSYFEVGRVEWLRAAGLSYRELEERGYGIVVVEVLAHYRRAAFFDDELTLRTELADLTRGLSALRVRGLARWRCTRHRPHAPRVRGPRDRQTGQGARGGPRRRP